VLSIKGGQIPERMPLLTSHWNDPLSALGSITNPQKALKDSPPRLRATGRIEMEGENSAVRRDLAHMIARGHIDAVSIRWDEVPGKTVRRVNLPSDHPYYVDSETATGPERWGSFFEEWVGREGSIVALGADQGALIGRAEETEGEVSAFWRALAQDAEEQQNAAKAAATLAALRVDATACLEAGASLIDVFNAISIPDNVNPETDFSPYRIGDTTILLPTPIADQLEDEREDRELEATVPEPQPEPDPEPAPRVDQPAADPWDLTSVKAPVDPEVFGRILSEAIEEQEVRIKRTVVALLAQATGKVK
jgi:hypothetical protein